MHVMEFGVAAVCVKKLPLQPQNPIPPHGHHPNQIEGFVLDSFQPVAEDVGGCRHQLHSPFSPTKSLGGDHHEWSSMIDHIWSDFGTEQSTRRSSWQLLRRAKRNNNVKNRPEAQQAVHSQHWSHPWAPVRYSFSQWLAHNQIRSVFKDQKTTSTTSLPKSQAHGTCQVCARMESTVQCREQPTFFANASSLPEIRSQAVPQALWG
jgi:hypothetical protein